jgi:D-arabinose 1-dehydrogenase-like Zn-dependent alcohol dehydrogenase
MKAARLKGPRRPLEIVELHDPDPGPGEVVVKIASSGVCHSDLHIANGEFKGVKYPITLGHEPAGYIHSFGPGVENLRKGQAVVVYAGTSCGMCEYCLRGEENYCESGEFFGFDHDGANAEYLLVKSPRYIFPIPRLSTDEACPLACAGITAYHAIKTEALPVLHPEDYVVVIGIGGLGHVGIQLLKKLSSSQIIAVDTRTDCLSLAEKLGADYTILAGRGLARQILKVSKKKLGAVLDFVGSDLTLGPSYEILRPGGRLVMVGEAGGSFKIAASSTNGREVHGSVYGTLSDMREIVELATQKQIKILVKTYPLKEANRVLKMLEEGQMIGRAVLKP